MISSQSSVSPFGPTVSAGKTSRLYDGRALRPSGWSPSEEEVDARGGAQSVLPDGHGCAVWSMFGVLEDAARRALQLQRLGWVTWVRVGLGQCSDGWSGGVVVWQIQSHKIKYNMYLERLAYEPNVSEV